MEKDFYNDDLDFFLKKADEHTMYPTDRVWKGVKRNLFWRKNWASLAGSVLFVCLLFFIPESVFNTIFNNLSFTGKPAGKGDIPASSGDNTIYLRSVPASPVASAPAKPVAASPVTMQIADADRSVLASEKINPSSILRPVKASAFSLVPVSNRNLDVASHVTISHPVVKDAEQQIDEPQTEELQTAEQEEAHGNVNWLEDMAVIKLTPKKQSRFNLQFYFSPVVSYRTLTDNNYLSHSSSQGNTPIAASQIDVNQYVDHQPSIGVELGSNLLFKATNNLTFKSGLQLNYSRYTIKAYKVGYEKASIALNSFGQGADTITSYTTIRNFNGYLQEQLQNQYVQVSVPIGAELKLLGNKRLQFNIAGTIQPTLLLFNDTYLLSTDYINYTKEPSLVRKWNFHSSAEAYISYQFANVRWQVGPQFRYQLMSSYADRYPIREYLMEYGIKFGISKTLK